MRGCRRRFPTGMSQCRLRHGWRKEAGLLPDRKPSRPYHILKKLKITTIQEKQINQYSQTTSILSPRRRLRRGGVGERERKAAAFPASCRRRQANILFAQCQPPLFLSHKNVDPLWVTSPPRPGAISLKGLVKVLEWQYPY